MAAASFRKGRQGAETGAGEESSRREQSPRTTTLLTATHVEHLLHTLSQEGVGPGITHLDPLSLTPILSPSLYTSRAFLSRSPSLDPLNHNDPHFAPNYLCSLNCLCLPNRLCSGSLTRAGVFTSMVGKSWGVDMRARESGLHTCGGPG
eukprot:117132-Chlamydomonas_euryale.AAC.14